MNNDDKYNFDKNLLSVSHNKELESAKKEWTLICKETRDKQDGLCICQRNVKHVIYMYNIKTKKTIIVGTTCHKKFNMGNNKTNTFLSDIFKNHIEKGEYTIIDNIVIYNKSIQEQLINYFQTKFDKLIKIWDIKSQIKYTNDDFQYSLEDLSEDINILIKEYELEYLTDIYQSICNKIIEYNEEDKKYSEELEKNIRYIKFNPDNKKKSELAQQFNKTEAYINAIQLNKIWKHISKSNNNTE